MSVSRLTHHDELAGQVSALWCLMIRHAVLHGELSTADDLLPLTALAPQRAPSRASANTATESVSCPVPIAVPSESRRCRDDLVVMTHRVSAFPFAGTQLRSLLARMLAEVDDLTRDLALRVGGRRFFDVPFEQLSAGEASDEPGDAPSCLTGLVEMLHDGPARPRLVAALFDNDRRAIIAQLVRLRTGVDDPGGHDLELVLGQLRAALRFVAEFEALPEVRKPLSPKPDRTRQLALLPEREDTLDAGLWGQDHLEEQQ